MLGLSVNEVMHRGGKFHTLKNHEYVFAYESSICALFCACNFFLLPSCLLDLQKIQRSRAMGQFSYKRSMRASRTV